MPENLPCRRSFGAEVGGHAPGDAIAQLVDQQADSETRGFVNTLVFGTLRTIVMRSTPFWCPCCAIGRSTRLPVLDRIILRMSIFENALRRTDRSGRRDRRSRRTREAFFNRRFQPIH